MVNLCRVTKIRRRFGTEDEFFNFAVNFKSWLSIEEDFIGIYGGEFELEVSDSLRELLNLQMRVRELERTDIPRVTVIAPRTRWWSMHSSSPGCSDLTRSASWGFAALWS